MFTRKRIVLFICVLLATSILANIFLVTNFLPNSKNLYIEKYKDNINQCFENDLLLAKLTLENIVASDIKDVSAAIKEYDKVEVTKAHYQLIGILELQLKNGENVDLFIKQIKSLVDIYTSGNYGEDLIRNNAKDIARIYDSILNNKFDFKSTKFTKDINDLNKLFKSFNTGDIKIKIQYN